MAVYRDALGHFSRFTTMIPRPMRAWLIAISIFLFAITILQYKSPHTISQAKSYATNKWQGKPTGQYWDNKGYKNANFISNNIPATTWNSDAAKMFWEEYFKVLTDGEPNFEKIRFRDDYKSGWFLPIYKSTESDTLRKQELNMTDGEIEELTSKHRVVSDKVKELAPRLPYKPGTRGIVYSTEMEVMPFLTVSLRMLRRTGTTLPVEIWIWDRSNWLIDPYGLRLCKEIFEPLGATCRFTTDYLPSSRPPPYDKPTEKYQNKYDALMFSPFEQVLLLDSDNVPIMPVDNIFTTKPFTSHGLILWPDYWRDTASPYFYKITSIPEEPPINRASSESGQIFLNKATHSSVLLLARYYGLYKYHYIRLLSQDPTDEGDKETFLRAAQAMKQPFYQVSEPPDRVGYRCNKSQKPIASGQHHPTDDHYLTNLTISRGNPSIDILNDAPPPRTLFIHSNLPKLDPAVYMSWHHAESWPDLQYCNTIAHRMWGPRSLTTLKYGWDVEKAVWDQMRWVACETVELQTHWFRPNPKMSNATITDVCNRFVALYLDVMAVDHHDGGAGGLAYSDLLVPAPYDEDGVLGGAFGGVSDGWARLAHGG